jgi:hypothetical protein
MSDLIISDPQIADRLRAIAERENRSIEQIIEDLLSIYVPPSGEILEPPKTIDPDNPPLGTLASLAAAGRRMSLRSGENDVSERSREILNTEYAEYLLNRMNRPSEDGENTNTD